MATRRLVDGTGNVGLKVAAAMLHRLDLGAEDARAVAALVGAEEKKVLVDHATADARSEQ